MARRVRGPLNGPLSAFGSGFEESLAEQGYSADSIERHLRLMVHVSRWLETQNLGGVDLSVECAAKFLQARRAAGWVHPASMAGMAPLLEYLRGVGAVPSGQAHLVGPVDVLVGDYRRYLVEERGLSERSTIPHYLAVASAFLVRTPIADPAELSGLTAGQVSGFVLSARRRRGLGDAKATCTRLRSFLRYLELEGLTSSGLVAAVPTIASWELTGLPRAVSASEVVALLASCDRSRPSGRRDYAILAVLSRLGLRAAEVAALRLADLHWRAGEISVAGKANRQDRLPLPHEVGEAIVEWLQEGRPCCSCVTVFTRILAPHRGLSARAVSGVVRQACGRAGLAPMGSHRLRHTVATETLRAGGSLSEVAHLLRQRSLAATSIYAKVDRAALSVVAQRWPGGVA